MPMRMAVVAIALLVSLGWVRAAEEPRLLERVTPLPMALDRDFQFRKTKLFFLGEKAAPGTKQKQQVSKTGDATSTSNEGAKSKSTSAVQEASITFERQYRLFGAVTKLDQHQRFGDYLDFFWRARRPGDVTVRLEYRQEKLHAHVQAQEISYANVRGSRKTEFKVIGDDYFDNGRIIAWRCLLIEQGRVVAEGRSFLWR
jgi:hypothetical protein